MRCTHKDADGVRCVKAEGHVSPHRCVSHLDDKPASGDEIARVQMVQAADKPNRERLCIACSADAQLRIANEMLFAAMNNLKALDVSSQVTRDHIEKSKQHAMIAMTQLNALIKRLP